ncbi:MAG: hypothetical protein HPAVJP_5430 [Candidatus Hepatoplasma vulgare]|nr:MAG: hypothetical protein HPAVJP_5430 [Candidatus Hepatoplasma sp.]
MTSDYSSLDWAIWGIIVVSCSFLLLSSILFYFFKYRKEGTKILTIEKLPIFGMFLAIFIFQAYITRVIPHTNEIIPFSMDDLTIVSIGFLYGPIEAIFFGAIADTTRTLINGWGFQIIAFFILPITGLISGYFGRMYKNKSINDKGSAESFIMKTNLLYISFLALTFTWLLFFVEDLRLEVSFIYLGINLFFIIIFMIWMFLLLKNKKYRDLSLIFFISLAIIIARVITGYVIRPYSQYFYFNYNWLGEINLRIASSSYLIYIRIFVYFYFIKSALYAIDIVK